MGVYTRFKRDPDGFRKLIELLETTPKVRRQKMIDVGMQEDPDYTEKALQYLMTFQDILEMEDSDLSEVLAKAPPRMSGFAFAEADEETKERVLRCAPTRQAAEIRDFMDYKIGASEIGGGQLKLVGVARELERRGAVKTKKIPSSMS